MGFGLPDDNLHAPNEKFTLECFRRGMKTAIKFDETSVTQRVDLENILDPTAE